MARRTQIVGRTQTVPANGTVSWGPQDLFLPTLGSSLVMLHVLITGTGANDNLSTVTNMQVQANGTAIVNISAPELRGFSEGFTPSNFAPAANTTAWTIYLNQVDEEYEGDISDPPEQNSADRVAFPLGASPTVQVTFASATGTATISLAYTVSDVAPNFYPYLYGTPSNIAASQTNAVFPYSERGLLRAIGLPTVAAANYARMRPVLNGKERSNMTWPAILEANRYRNPETLTNSLFHKFVGMDSVAPGSYFEFDTGASAVVGDRLCFYAWRKQGDLS